jgi:hypothetical protein
MWVPLVMLLTTYTFLLFPDGKLISPEWRRAAWFGGIVIGVSVLVLAVYPGQLTNMVTIANPLGLDALTPAADILFIAVMVSISASVGSGVYALIHRYQRADQVTRQQLKWLALVSVLVLLTLAFNGITEYPFLVTIFSIPVAIGIAILRYRLYDIDLIINRTLVYGLLSALLALIYFGSVALLQGALRTLTGQESPLVLVVSTLGIAALFNPLRARLQHFIDRRFYRQKYDAQRALDRFNATLRREINLSQLSDEVLHVLADTVQPTHASLWLRDMNE